VNKGRIEQALNFIGMMPPSENLEDIKDLKSKDYQKAHLLYKKSYPDFMDNPYIVYDFADTKLMLAQEWKFHKGKFKGKHSYKLDYDTRVLLKKEAVELLRRGLQLLTECKQKGWCWFQLAKSLNFLKEPANEIKEAYLKAIQLCPEEIKFKRTYNKWEESQNK
jgi:ATP-dependent DNA helicase RecG